VRFSILERFPGDARIPEHLMEIGNIYMEQLQDNESARAFYKNVLELDSSTERVRTLQQLARNNLAAIDRTVPTTMVDVLPSERRTLTICLLVANFVIIAAIGVAVALRRRRGKPI
jgi:hypothetical protein